MNNLGNVQILLANLSHPLKWNADNWIGFSYYLAEQSKLGAISSHFINYPLQGCTTVVYLKESHIVVSTYPEFGTADLELVSCKEFNPRCIEVACKEFNIDLLSHRILGKTKSREWSLF